MTKLETTVTEDERGLLRFIVEIYQTESTTDKEMEGVTILSDEVNKILQAAQLRSSLKKDWKEQYRLNGIEVEAVSDIIQNG